MTAPHDDPIGPAGWDVLIVDDEPVVRGAIHRVLAAEGFSVAEADDARCGLAHPAAVTCRLLICDLMLPDQPGIEVIHTLRELRPDRPVITITGYTTPENVRRAREAGGVAFLPKPFDAPELLAAVRRALSIVTVPPEEIRK